MVLLTCKTALGTVRAIEAGQIGWAACVVRRQLRESALVSFSRRVPWRVVVMEVGSAEYLSDCSLLEARYEARAGKETDAKSGGLCIQSLDSINALSIALNHLKGRNILFAILERDHTTDAREVASSRFSKSHSN